MVILSFVLEEAGRAPLPCASSLSRSSIGRPPAASAMCTCTHTIIMVNFKSPFQCCCAGRRVEERDAVCSPHRLLAGPAALTSPCRGTCEPCITASMPVCLSDWPSEVACDGRRQHFFRRLFSPPPRNRPINVRRGSLSSPLFATLSCPWSGPHFPFRRRMR